jgi:hypothetical protein
MMFGDSNGSKDARARAPSVLLLAAVAPRCPPPSRCRSAERERRRRAQALRALLPQDRSIKTGAKVLYGGRPSLPWRLGVRMHFRPAPHPICACVLAASISLGAAAALLEFDLLCFESCTG